MDEKPPNKDDTIWTYISIEWQNTKHKIVSDERLDMHGQLYQGSIGAITKPHVCE
jgi:hypothetical protein